MTDPILLGSYFFDAVMAVAMLALIGGVSYCIAVSLLPMKSTAQRWSAALIVGQWYQVGVFHLLSWFKAYRLLPVMVTLLFVAVLVAIVLMRRSFGEDTIRSRFADDLETIRKRLGQALSSGERALFVGCIAVAGVALFRGIISIPITTDSLLYHMLYSGMFVQQGGVFDLDAPGDWGLLCRFYPTGGEIITAWWMLPFHGDLVAGLSCFPSWCLIMTSLYELGRHLGLRPRRAVVPTLMMGFMPAVCAYIAAIYVEIPLLGSMLGGTLFFLIAWQTGEWPAFALCGAAFGTALSIKVLALSGIAVAFILLASKCLMCVSARWRPSFWLLMSLTAAVVGLVHYCESYIKYGSPVWPFPLNVLFLHMFAGSPARAENMKYLAQLTDQHISGGSFLVELGWIMKWMFGFGPVSIGPGGLIAVFMTPFGLYRLWKKRQRGFVVFAALALLVSFVGLLGGGMWKFHVLFATVNSRLYTYPIALMTLLGMISLERWSEEARRKVLNGLVALSVGAFVFSYPVTWSTGYHWLDMILILLPFIAALMPFPVFPAFRHTRFPCVAGLLMVMMLTFLPMIKGELRPRQLLAAFEGYELSRVISSAWVYCDNPANPRKIAFAAGWNGVLGYNWSWGPLLGKKLQNHLSYIPITKSGKIIEYDDPKRIAACADFKSWHRRLAEKGIDTIVLFPPYPPEHAWVTAHPELFVPEGPASPTMVFRVIENRRNAIDSAPGNSSWNGE